MFARVAKFYSVCVVAALFAAAAALAGPAAAQEKLRVVATTTDLRSLVEAVGGDRVTAVNLVPAGADAEDYQPKPQDIALLKGARLVVRVGLDFDLWLEKLLARATFTSGLREIQRGGPGYIDASYAIAVLEVRGASVGPSDGHAHGSGNPHYWLDPQNAEIITGNILEGLSRIDPQNAPVYERNRLAFLRRLANKLQDWEARIAPLRAQALIAYHNDWAYFVRRFRLNLVDFIEPKPGVPPSAARLAAVIRIMRERGIRIIISQPSQPERHVAFLAQQTGATVVRLAGSVGALPGTDDYLSLFDVNIGALAAALGKR